jgi:DNA-binding NarL/FixJ family response regulator
MSLSPANAPLMMLVVPIALIGRRWGPRSTAAATGIALTLVAAQTWISGGQIGIVGDLSRSAVFLTVAVLAGARYPHFDRNDNDAAGARQADSSPGDGPEELLSRRELEVLTLIAEGATNGEIGERLWIAESTVQSHVKQILRKLGVRNRTEAAARYLRR